MAKEFNFLIPESISDQENLEEIAELLREHPGKSRAYGLLVEHNANEEGGIGLSGTRLDFEEGVKDSPQLFDELYDLIEELTIEEIDLHLERLNATMRWTAQLDSDGDTQWEVQVTRRGKALATVPGKTYPEMSWHLHLLEELESLVYPDFFKPLDEEFVVASKMNPDIEIDFDEFFECEEEDPEEFNRILGCLGVPSGQDDACWCGSKDKRRDCCS